MRSPLQDRSHAGFRRGICVVGVIAIVLIAYGPIWRAGFVWDDGAMVADNRLVRASDGLYRFWCTAENRDYWPVTSTSFWLEWRLWGLNPLGYHLTNLALHLAEVGLLWSILRRLQIPGAWIAAVLFAVHPLNVESVTWIAERKNLLAMLFYLAAIRCFLETGAEGASAFAKIGRWYSLSVLAFALAMLAKGSVAMLPLVLAGLIWSRRPLRPGDAARLAPFVLIATILAGVDVWFQHHGSAEIIRPAGALERLLGAGAAVCFYLFKSIWPEHLVFIYPLWRIDPASLRWWIPLLGVGGATWFLVRFGAAPRTNAWRPALFAWGYFCVSLVPALGFTDVYFMKYSLVADHYAHVALIGVVAAAGFGAHRLYQRAAAAARVWLIALGGLAVAGLAARTWSQNLIYRDNLTLFRATRAENADSWMVANDLGVELAAHGEMEAAIDEYRHALSLRPDYPDAHNNLGNVFAAQGKPDQAIAEYGTALRLNPDYAQAHYNLGNVFLRQPGRLAAAAVQFAKTVLLKPEDAAAHTNLGVALRSLGRRREALTEFERALRLQPDSASAHANLADALTEAGDNPSLTRRDLPGK